MRRGGASPGAAVSTFDVAATFAATAVADDRSANQGASPSLAPGKTSSGSRERYPRDTAGTQPVATLVQNVRAETTMGVHRRNE